MAVIGTTGNDAMIGGNGNGNDLFQRLAGDDHLASDSQP
jgi:hypothetical protein